MRTRWGWGVRSGAWRTCLLVALACLSGSMTTLLADKPSRDDVQAAYLYNFGKFVRWPESRGLGPMLVCVAGQASLGQTIGKLVEGEQIDGPAWRNAIWIGRRAWEPVRFCLSAQWSADERRVFWRLRKASRF
jgi:hypothetical protein